MRLTIAQNAVRVLLRMPGKISEQVLVTGYVSLAWRKKNMPTVTDTQRKPKEK